MGNFTQLIALALNCSKSGNLIVSDIYKFISQNFPYYDMKQIQGWKNSVRHTLSLGRFFEKKETIHNFGKSTWNGKSIMSWTMSQDKVQQLMENVLLICNKMEEKIKSTMQNPEFFENFLTGPMHEFEPDNEAPMAEKLEIKEEFIIQDDCNEESNLETILG